MHRANRSSCYIKNLLPGDEILPLAWILAGAFSDGAFVANRDPAGGDQYPAPKADARHPSGGGWCPAQKADKRHPAGGDWHPVPEADKILNTFIREILEVEYLAVEYLDVGNMEVEYSGGWNLEFENVRG